MKLNLAADFEVCGKHFVLTFAIHESNNLVGLREMTATTVPTDGGWVQVFPMFLLMCESQRKAKAVACEWQKNYEEQGRNWDGKPFAKDEILKWKAAA